MPGIGRKSAQRIAFHLLERDRDGAVKLSQALSEAVDGIGHCKRCRMFTEHELCNICSAAGRDESSLCAVMPENNSGKVFRHDRGLEFATRNETAVLVQWPVTSVLLSITDSSHRHLVLHAGHR